MTIAALLPPEPAISMCKEVLVYNGEGAGARSVQSAVQTLRSSLQLGPSSRPALKVLCLTGDACSACMCSII